MTAYIIFMNDNPEAVVLDDENLAAEISDKLMNKYYRDNRQAYLSRNAYFRSCFWHLHKVDVIEK